MELLTLVSFTALVASAFALLVAVGSALRVQGLQYSDSSVEGGLPLGARVDDTLAPFVGQTGLDAWLRGPTLVVVAKTTCPSCRELVANMNRRSAELSSFRVLMIERGHGGESMKGSAEFDALWVQDEGNQSKELFRTNVSPHAFLIENGKVVSQHTGALAVTFVLGQRDLGTSKPAVATSL